MKFIMKGDEGMLSAHLSHKEFDCRCTYDDCIMGIVRYELLHNFEMLRSQYGAPIKVTSGYRCQRHNKDEGGVNASLHKIGSAIDLTSSRLDILEAAAREHFDSVIRYENFVHCQMSIQELPDIGFINCQMGLKE